MAEEIYFFDNDDPDSQAAFRRARETFRYFWREQFLEQRRIIPGLTLASIKLPFSDGDLNDKEFQVEHMWVNDIDFDGRHIHGTLINEPNWLKSVSVGDNVQVLSSLLVIGCMQLAKQYMEGFLSMPCALRWPKGARTT